MKQFYLNHYKGTLVSTELRANSYFMYFVKYLGKKNYFTPIPANLRVGTADQCTAPQIGEPLVRRRREVDCLFN